ncbi:hypothetical protein [Alicyclobacillus mengziensis]|uniref:Copper amine oxidase-like N-terminal domain-containing protein n=1 Tax=Alicyclobacillus mengziensis TaxID=2931921 RepID=A0A9X7W497_9BACL|nr:hypothetical protein [Alicyclobacillus mengziensis]QSO50145.1 hypothetical protein JZ786_24575 [Alicyclobacillus mengziensis]
MKTKLLLATLTTTAVISSFAVAHAATTNYLATHIELNGADVINPVHTTAVDPSTHQETSFLPIYYAMEVLDKLGVTSNWNGTTWSLSVPSSLTPDLSNPTTATNQMYFVMNGVRVEAAPTLVTVDPSSKQNTTFIPIYYLEQALKRIGVSSTWNGTTWDLTQASVAPVTQSDMATAMWNTFASISWDINSHPSMSEVGITPSSTAPVTGGQVATWLSEWASKAKGLTVTNGPQKGQWIPYNLKYEVSTDPFTWAQMNGLYQGTSVSSTSSNITASDMATITSNLKWWLTGDRVVDGVYHLHVPFYSNYYLWRVETSAKPTSSGASGGNGIPESAYQSYLADETRYYDEITAKVNGTSIQLTLPDTSQSTSNMAWDVVDGYWEYGGWQAKDNRGGKTLNVPNNGTAGLNIDTASLNPDMYLEGFQIAFNNTGTDPGLSQAYDWGEGQNPPAK